MENAVDLPKLFYSVKEAAQVCGIGRSRMYELTHIDGFPAIRNGQRVLVIASKLEAWIIANSEKV